MEYQLITSTRRKSIGLQVKNGKITVRAPKFVSRDFIEQLIVTKERWLKEKLKQQELVECKRITFDEGSYIWLNGEVKTLNIRFGLRSEVIECNSAINDIIIIIKHRISAGNKRNPNFNSKNDAVSYLNKLLPSTLLTSLPIKSLTTVVDNSKPTPKQVKQKLEVWYKTKAEKYIKVRLAELSQQTGLIPNTVKIRQYKARWGSCNNRGELSFNYLLMMAPRWVVDYVIIHELCHLKHLNHSKQFWLIVEKHYPLFREAKRWLNENQHHLQWRL